MLLKFVHNSGLKKKKNYFFNFPCIFYFHSGNDVIPEDTSEVAQSESCDLNQISLDSTDRIISTDSHNTDATMVPTYPDGSINYDGIIIILFIFFFIANVIVNNYLIFQLFMKTKMKLMVILLKIFNLHLHYFFSYFFFISCVSVTLQGSVVKHLISQVKIGMDLTKVALPTFILEKRSLLEMYADYLAHPDLFLK